MLPVLFLMFSGSLLSQSINKNMLVGVKSEIKSDELQKQFSSYELYHIDTDAINQMLLFDNHLDLHLQLDNIELTRLMERRYLVNSNTVFSTLDENGVKYGNIDINQLCRTYRGFENERERMSLNENFMCLNFEYEGKYYTLEQLKNYQKNTSSDVFILYQDNNIIIDKSFNCLLSPNEHKNIKNQSFEKSDILNNCIEIEISFVIDYYIYQAYQFNTDNLFNDFFNLLNQVEGLYSQFNTEFIVADYLVETANVFTWGYTSVANDLLQNFANWGNNGQFFTSDFDVATLWTGIDICGINPDEPNICNDVRGAATYVGSGCSSDKYNIVEYFTNTASHLSVVWAHEIAHNLGATHDNSTENWGHIMSQFGYLDATEFSPVSVNEITNYLNSSSASCIEQYDCSSDCPSPTNVTAELRGYYSTQDARVYVDWDNMDTGGNEDYVVWFINPQTGDWENEATGSSSEDVSIPCGVTQTQIYVVTECPDGTESPSSQNVFLDVDCLLPIEMLTPLQAHIKNKSVILEWQTATETNNAGFEIQKSRNGAEWEKIGWQDGQGSSSNPFSYTHTDINPFNGTTYYRLKQLDFDGYFSYSNVANVIYTNGNIALYPNPVKNILYIIGLDDRQMQKLSLFDMNGKMIRTFESPVNRVDVSGISQGMYVVKATIDGGVFYQKIVIE